MNKKDKYGFQTTRTSILITISSPEGWERFCERYAEPIKNVLNAINNRRKGRLLRPEEVDDAFGVIIAKLNKKLRTYDPKYGRLRKWLSTVIRNAIFDYCKEREKAQKHLLRVPDCPHDGMGDDAVDAKTLIENIPGKSADNNMAWLGFLAVSSMNIAEVSRPWSARDKKIIKVIKEELEKIIHEKLTKKKTDRRSDKEIASAFGITEDNLRKIRSRYIAEVRKQYGEFKQDDPPFFAAMKKYSMSFDVLLDEYLKKVGGEKDLAERRKEFKGRQLLD